MCVCVLGGGGGEEEKVTWLCWLGLSGPFGPTPLWAKLNNLVGPMSFD